jgi:hypothetical protein
MVFKMKLYLFHLKNINNFKYLKTIQIFTMQFTLIYTLYWKCRYLRLVFAHETKFLYPRTMWSMVSGDLDLFGVIIIVMI